MKYDIPLRRLYLDSVAVKGVDESFHCGEEAVTVLPVSVLFLYQARAFQIDDIGNLNFSVSESVVSMFWCGSLRIVKYIAMNEALSCFASLWGKIMYA